MRTSVVVPARSVAGKDGNRKVAIRAQGSLIEFRFWRPRGRVGGGGVRGRIRGFSAAARSRLMRLLARLHPDALPLFVTLTYPGEWSGDPRRWKRDLDAFLKRLCRRYPDCSGVWKLEPQKRGAPHFHLLVFGVPWISADWLSRVWWEVVGSGDEAHLRAGTRVERVRTRNGVFRYAAKYLGKTMDVQDLPACWENPGRWWGVWGRDRLPWASVSWVRICCDANKVWLRFCSFFLRNLGHLRAFWGSSPPPRFRWIVNDAQAALDVLLFETET